MTVGLILGSSYVECYPKKLKVLTWCYSAGDGTYMNNHQMLIDLTLRGARPSDLREELCCPLLSISLDERC